MHRRRRTWLTALAILTLIAALLVYAAWPGRSTFTISPETTYVTGALDQHGFVDYETPLNERLRLGITPNNNANVLIWQAVGPHPEGGTMPQEYFQWLGIESPPDQGGYFVPWHTYAKEHLKDQFQEQGALLLECPSRAEKWPWTAKSEPELADWLHRNEKPLELLTEATRRPNYHNPLVPKRGDDGSPGMLIGALLPNVQKCREVAAAFACRAMRRVGEGRTDEAWDDLLACHRLGRLVGRGGTLIELLVGIAIDHLASKADLAFLDQAKLTTKQIRACLRDLQQLPAMPGVADKLDLSERFMALEAMILVAHRGWPAINSLSGYQTPPPKDDDFMGRLFMQSIDWDPALRNANQWYDRCVSASLIADRAGREEEWLAINQDLKALKQRTTGPGLVTKALAGPTERGELLGNIIICLMLPAAEKVQGAADRGEQTQRNLHLAFALAAYQRDHGRYPAKLDELAPKYLDKIPDDLFSGKPLIYKPEAAGYLFYSVGINGIDDEGRGSDDEPRADDVNVRIPVSEPRGKK